jgi:hypothetical protein
MSLCSDTRLYARLKLAVTPFPSVFTNAAAKVKGTVLPSKLKHFEAIAIIKRRRDALFWRTEMDYFQIKV